MCMGDRVDAEDSMKEWIRGLRWIIVVVILTALTVLALQNRGDAPLRLLAWTYTIPLFLLILVSCVAGVLVTILFLLPGHIRLAWRVRKLTREAQAGAIHEQEHAIPMNTPVAGKDPAFGRRERG